MEFFGEFLLTHKTSELPSYRNQSIDLLCHQLTGFYMMANLAFNELKKEFFYPFLLFICISSIYLTLCSESCYVMLIMLCFEIPLENIHVY